MAIICRVGASWTTGSTRPFDDADFYPASSKDWQLAQHLRSEESCDAERSTNSTAFPMHRIRSWNGPWWRCARSTLAKRRTGFDVSDTFFHPECNFVGIRFLENRLSDLKKLRSGRSIFLLFRWHHSMSDNENPSPWVWAHGVELAPLWVWVKNSRHRYHRLGPEKPQVIFIYYLYNLYDLIFAIWSFILLTEAKAPLHLRILPSILCWP